MKRAGKVVAEALAAMRAAIVPGMDTAELDRIAEALIRSRGAVPSFKGYNGFPASVCVSVNDEVVHGLPGRGRLREGDIVGIDVGAIADGYHADAAATYAVGKISPQARRLVRVTRQALYDGIAQARAGRTLRDLARAIEARAAGSGYSVVRELVGHSIGREMHEGLQVANYADGATDLELRPGMTLAIEPMVNEGGWEITKDADGWTFRTQDGSLSAHWEHTVVVRDGAAEIITAH
ncbi:MAG: type I methionyl aminopeptidase [Armatimonadota bacterium]|nr:MAG: type I methionyl aminopeptidase [Armatimonadota bacterium]